MTGDAKWQKDAADQNFDYMFKLLIIGNSSVGKTRYLNIITYLRLLFITLRFYKGKLIYF